jgi:hypothetical protein
MNNQEKSLMYETILLQGDRLNREKSKLKSENAGINLSPEKQKRLSEIDNQLLILESRLNSLMQ